MLRNRLLGIFLLLALGLLSCNLQPGSQPTHTPTETSTGSHNEATTLPAVTSTATASPTYTPPPNTPTNTPSPPTTTPTPTKPACLSEGGNIAVKSIQSRLLPQPLAFRVYTPPCYAQNTSQRYPVLYIIHGQTYNDDQWDRLGLDERADQLIAEGKIPPLIIVMPRDRIWKQPPENNFGKALVSDLVPEIDKTYRTIPERKYRAVGGLSWGANWAVHLGLTHWELFGTIGAHSLPVFSTDGPRLATWLDEIPKSDLPRIYMDAGEHDRWLQYTLWFEDLLTQKGIPHEWHLFTGYHDEAYWSSHVEDYLLWYTQDW